MKIYYSNEEEGTLPSYMLLCSPSNKPIVFSDHPVKKKSFLYEYSCKKMGRKSLINLIKGLHYSPSGLTLS